MKKVLKLSSLLLVLVALLGLTACAPKDPAKAKDKLEKKEYAVVVDAKLTPAAMKLFGIDGVESVVTATKKVDDNIEVVTAVLFAESSQAKEYKDKVAEYAKKNGEESDVKQAGKWLYYGTEQAMKDFN